MKAAGTQQPAALPNFFCLPPRVSGTPNLREILPFIADTPVARFHEKDRPGIPFLLRPTSVPFPLGVSITYQITPRALILRGIPYILATCAERADISATYSSAPFVSKPYDVEQLRKAIIGCTEG